MLGHALFCSTQKYMDTLFLSEQRCQCGKLLLKGVFFDAALEIKCKKCGRMNIIGSIKLTDDKFHYLLILNEKGIVTNVSDSACCVLGYTYSELIKKPFTQRSCLKVRRERLICLCVRKSTCGCL